ncbi:MAG: DUF1697 domain-containing protein [Candidatus Binataceae bacterium]
MLDSGGPTIATTHIALLRAINVGGHKPVAMSDLRNLLTKLHFSDARSLLQSGNLVFGSKAQTAANIERLLEEEAEKRLGCSTHFFVRTAGEWHQIIEHNPFPREAQRDPSHLVLMLLKNRPDTNAVKTLQSAITGPEIVRIEGRQAYVVYREGIARSRLTNALIETKLGTRVTGRNWNTVQKLAVLAGL